jgi:hypothetical protein
MNGSSIRWEPVPRLTYSAPVVAGCPLAGDLEDALYSIFERLIDVHRLCNLRALLRAIAESEMLEVLASNRVDLVRELMRLERADSFNLSVSWSTFLEMIDGSTDIKRARRVPRTLSAAEGFAARVQSIFTAERHSYSQRLRQAGIDTVDAPTERQQLSASERFKQISETMRMAYGAAIRPAQDAAIAVQTRMQTKAAPISSVRTISFIEAELDAALSPTPMEIVTNDSAAILLAAKLSPLTVKEVEAIEGVINGPKNAEVILGIHSNILILCLTSFGRC